MKNNLSSQSQYFFLQIILPFMAVGLLISDIFYLYTSYMRRQTSLVTNHLSNLEQLKDTIGDFLIFFGGGGSFLNILLALILILPLGKNFPHRSGLILAALIPNLFNWMAIHFNLYLSEKYFMSGIFFISFYLLIKSFIASFKMRQPLIHKLFISILLMSTLWSFFVALLLFNSCALASCF